MKQVPSSSKMMAGQKKESKNKAKKPSNPTIDERKLDAEEPLFISSLTSETQHLANPDITPKMTPKKNPVKNKLKESIIAGTFFGEDGMDMGNEK